MKLQPVCASMSGKAQGKDSKKRNEEGKRKRNFVTRRFSQSSVSFSVISLCMSQPHSIVAIHVEQWFSTSGP